jgi:hypothetical protein
MMGAVKVSLAINSSCEFAPKKRKRTVNLYATARASQAAREGRIRTSQGDYFCIAANFGVADTPANTVPGLGNDETGSNQYWEEATTVAIDPQDSQTFWGVGEWLSQNQTSCCNWSTQVFLCRAGRTGSQAYCQ